MIAVSSANSNVATFASSTGAVRLSANQVAEKLLAAEAAIDAAIAAVAALTATIPAAAQDAKVAPHVGHEALMHAMESCQQLVKSRTNIIRTHKSLRAVQDDFGLGEVAFGSCDQPPSGEIQDQPFGNASVAA